MMCIQDIQKIVYLQSVPLSLMIVRVLNSLTYTSENK